MAAEKKIFANQINEGQSIEDIFLVRDMIRAETRSGKPYLIMNLMDRSGDVAGRLWENTNKVIDVVTKNVLSVIKPFLNIKPSIDFYNNVLKESQDFYPLLIQETFSPTVTQRAFKRIRQLDKVELEK